MRNQRKSWVMGHGSWVKKSGHGLWVMKAAIALGVLGFFLSPVTCHLSPAFAEPSPDELRNTIREYILNQEEGVGTFVLPDPLQIGKLRTLELDRVHERVGKTGNYYYSCTDMRDVATGELLDLDFDVSDNGGNLEVVAVRIHKDDGNPRYTYDDNDNLVQLR